MVDFVFGNYRKVVYLAQTVDPELEDRARSIAERLKLDYEYRFTGYGDMEGALATLQLPGMELTWGTSEQSRMICSEHPGTDRHR